MTCKKRRYEESADEEELDTSGAGSNNNAPITQRNKKGLLSSFVRKTISNFSIESIMRNCSSTISPLPPASDPKKALLCAQNDHDQDTIVDDNEEVDREEDGDETEEIGSPGVSPTPSSFSGGSSEVELSSSNKSDDERSSSKFANQMNNNVNNSTGNSKRSTRQTNATSSNHLLRQQVCFDPRLKAFECHLVDLEQWKQFHSLDTEMIITKQGRRMFPPVKVSFSLVATQAGRAGEAGNQATQQANNQQAQQQQQQQQQTGQQLQLNARDKYQVLMDIPPFDNKRYRYAYHKSSWQQAGKSDPPSPTKLFLHPDGPFTLEQLKRQVISFEKIKLTNSDPNKHGFIVLNSMHRYQPRIHLVLWRGKDSQNLANAPISALEQETYKTFIFSETIFTAVTAYQNHSITKLKIDSNPFAKGFRDSSRLSDIELETMQDLITENQCPFSPPRAPNHFPHFLFGGQPPPVSLEDPLIRERTIMALDSYLQHQQQQQQQHQHQHQHHHQAGSPQRSMASGNQLAPVQHQQGPPGSLAGEQMDNQHQQGHPVNAYAPQAQLPHHAQPGAPHFLPGSAAMAAQLLEGGGGGAPPAGCPPQINPFSHFLSHLSGLQQPQMAPPTSQAATNAASQQASIEKLIMQQQFAAAMAAAGAAHHPLHSLFGLSLPPSYNSSSGQQQQQQQHFLSSSATNMAKLLDGGAASPASNQMLGSCQISPSTTSSSNNNNTSTNQATSSSAAPQPTSTTTTPNSTPTSSGNNNNCQFVSSPMGGASNLYSAAAAVAAAAAAARAAAARGRHQNPAASNLL